MFSIVVLPQPECPMRHTNSPGFDREMQVLEDGRVDAAAAGEALGDAFDSDERIGHSHAPHPEELLGVSPCHSGNVTSFVSLASARSSSMPTSPIARMPLMMLAIDRLFHSFHTK